MTFTIFRLLYIRLNETGMIVHVKGKKAFLLLNRKLTVASLSNNGQLYPWFDHKIKRIYILSSLVCGSIQGNKQVTLKMGLMLLYLQRRLHVLNVLEIQLKSTHIKKLG